MTTFTFIGELMFASIKCFICKLHQIMKECKKMDYSCHDIRRFERYSHVPLSLMTILNHLHQRTTPDMVNYDRICHSHVPSNIILGCCLGQASLCPMEVPGVQL